MVQFTEGAETVPDLSVYLEKSNSFPGLQLIIFSITITISLIICSSDSMDLFFVKDISFSKCSIYARKWRVLTQISPCDGRINQRSI